MEDWNVEDDGDQRAFRFPPKSLGDILTRRLDLIDKQIEPLGGLRVIDKVSFGGVLHVRSEERKRGYPLYRALAGDLIISKIRVGQGSFCIVSDNMVELAVSPEYPVYRPDTAQVDAAFLSLCLRGDRFMHALRGTGNTTKQRITPTRFERQRSPLSSLPEQQAMVTAYVAALHEAAALEAGADAADAAGLAAFETALGLATPPPLLDRPVFVARFKALDRWSHDAALRACLGPDAATSPHPMVALGDMVADLRVGVSPICQQNGRIGDGWGVLKLSAVTGGRFRDSENKAVKDNGAINRSLEVRQGDVLIARGSGQTQLVRAAVLVDRPSSGLMLCD